MKQEAWILGGSARKVDDFVQERHPPRLAAVEPFMGMNGISKSQVSELCNGINAHVSSFLERPNEGEWTYLCLSATDLKVRENGRIVSVAAVTATGVNTEGRREILGLGLGPFEATIFSLRFLRGLEKRGLKGVRLVVSDAHEGLKSALAQTVAAAIKTVFMRVDHVTVSKPGDKSTISFARVPKLAAIMDGAEADVIAYLAFPKSHWPKFHSTNPTEWLNREVKRRADDVGLSPNEASTAPLVGAILLE